MSTIQEAIKSVQDYGDNFTKALERHRGFLGDGDGTVYVADRDGYVYIRHRQAESADITGTMEPEEVIYARSDIPPIEGYPVIFGRDIDTEDFQLLATDSSQLLGWIFDKYIKDHHEQHEFDEFDTVWIQKQAMLPLLVYPTVPASTTLNVHQGWYQWDTDWHFFETTTTSELSSYIPTTSGKARFLLVCIDGETEELYYESGDTFIIFLPPQDCEDRIPPPPEGKIPLAAIYLPYGTTSFDWDILYDVRLLFSGGGSMSTGSAPRDAAYVTLAYDDILSAERLLSEGNGIVVTDNGANDTVVVSLDDHDHAGLTAGDGGIIPGTSVELPEIPVATYDDVTDWFNTTQSAGAITGGAITDNEDGTIDVAIGFGYIKVADDHIADTLFFDWPATPVPLVPVDQAKNWVYVDYNGGTPVVGITDDKTIITRRNIFTIARLWADGNDLHILEKGQFAYDVSSRTHRYLVDVFSYQRASGMITAEKNQRYLTVTAGSMFRGLNNFDTDAFDTTEGGTSFTFYYRDGIGGWTTGAASQIDNSGYDDGDGALGTVSPNQYGVFWVYICHANASRLYVQYGQDSYKLAAAQESMVPDPPEFLSGFANLIARIIIERDSANIEEIAYPWEEIFMPQAATDHNQLGNLQGGSGPDEYYHLSLAAYEELSAGAGALPPVAGAGYALVSDGVNSWAVDQTPAWTGRHSFEDGITFAGGAGVNSVVIPDGLADAFDITNGVEFLRINTDDDYFLIDPGATGIKVGIGTTTVPHVAVGYAKFAIEGANASADGPHVQFTTATDDYPLMQILPYGHDNVAILFDAYLDAGGWKSSDAGSSFGVYKLGDTLRLVYDVAAAGGAVTWNDGLVLDTSGNVVIGAAAALAKLDVRGAIIADGTAIDPDTTANTVMVGGIADGGGWGVSAGIGMRAAGVGDTAGIGVAGNALYFGVGDGANANSLDTWLSVAMANLDTRFYGNVGIGIAAPQGLLHGYDTFSGFMYWEGTVTGGGETEVLPAGSVTYGLHCISVGTQRGADPAQQYTPQLDTPAAGGVGTTVFGIGGQAILLQLYNTGQVTINQTLGVITTYINLWLIWQ